MQGRPSLDEVWSYLVGWQKVALMARMAFYSGENFGRAWWADPFMKQAYLLAALAVVWQLGAGPIAADVAMRLPWIIGGATYVLLIGMPVVLVLAALRCAFDSVWYWLGQPLTVAGAE